jgi:hypothetical protein
MRRAALRRAGILSDIEGVLLATTKTFARCVSLSHFDHLITRWPTWMIFAISKRIGLGFCPPMIAVRTKESKDHCLVAVSRSKSSWILRASAACSCAASLMAALLGLPALDSPLESQARSRRYRFAMNEFFEEVFASVKILARAADLNLSSSSERHRVT